MDAYNEGVGQGRHQARRSGDSSRASPAPGSSSRAVPPSVVDGPFTKSKEIVAGYWLWEVGSLEEAVEWAKRCPTDPKYGSRQVVEVRPLWELEDFRTEDIPEVAEQSQGGTRGAS